MNFFAQRRSTVLLSGIAVLFALTFCNGESGGGDDVKKGKFTDSRDGKEYEFVRIGNQTWMAENLNYQTGTSWCYGGDNSNCEKYGRLYDWKTATTVCPSGWHLPSRDEWRELAKAAGGTGEYGNGGIAGRKLKSTSGWYDMDGKNSGNGTDAYGFSALPGGYRYSGGGFEIAANYGLWWTATEICGSDAYYWYMFYNHENVIVSSNVKKEALSVRCIEN